MLIRMLSNINKWDGSKKPNRADGYLCGDAIGDLKCTNNRLSVWKVDNTDDEKDALVALALNRSNVAKISYCFLDEKDLSDFEIDVWDDQPGTAPGISDDSILKKHRDLVDLDFWRIGFLADYMTSRLEQENERHFLTARDVRNLLNSYKENNKIDIEKVNLDLAYDMKWKSRMQP